jgi:hypothetical protein
MTKRTPAPDPFNNPFGKLKLDQPKKPEAAKPAPPPPPKPKRSAEEDEAALFLEAMGEVQQKKPDRKHVDDHARPDPRKLAEEESESLAQLAELVALDGPSRDPKLLDRLDRGLFRIDATLPPGDPQTLLVQARREGKRCVRLAAPPDLSKGRLPKIVLAASGCDVILRR